MATEWYVGTGGNDSTGDGTTYATRWLTLQKFIDAGTTGQPNRVNCNGSETLSASLDFTTRPMTLTSTNWLTIQGTDGVAGDGGTFSIDAGTNQIVGGNTIDGLFFKHCKFTNWGTSYAFSLDNNCGFMENEFDGEGSRANVVDMDVSCIFIGNKVHGIALDGFGINVVSEGQILNNYVQIDSATASDEVIAGGPNTSYIGNVISMKTTESCVGIGVGGDGAPVMNNTVFNQSAGTGTGIDFNSASSDYGSCLNNIVCGFSGTGGVGIKGFSGAQNYIFANNQFWDNSTNFDITTESTFRDVGTASLGGNPFVSTGNADHNDDDFTLSAALVGYPTELYDPDDTQAGRNQTVVDCGALQLTPSGGSASGARNPFVGPIG